MFNLQAVVQNIDLDKRRLGGKATIMSSCGGTSPTDSYSRQAEGTIIAANTMHQFPCVEMFALVNSKQLQVIAIYPNLNLIS
jgi:hypothetical protein